MDKLTLLIADDVEMNRTVIKRLLGNTYNVLEAVNGYEAIETLKQIRVDVMILDIIMPEMDGIEALKEIKKHPEWNQIGILVATSTKEKTERMVLEAGADDVVAKPYDPIVIKQRLSNILAKKEMESLTEEDVKGISGEERKYVDETLISIRNICDMAKENIENPKLQSEFIAKIQDKTQSLIDLLVGRED